MKINEYQQAALRTANSDKSEDLILNGILGLCGETGEVSDHIKKHLFQGHELDKNQMINELGDVCWYIAILAKGLDVDLETVMKKNIEKLMKRYPDGFKVKDSICRKDEETMKNKQIEVPMLTDEKFDKIEEFAALVKPVQEWMLKNYNPHSKIIIEVNGATVTTDDMFIPLKVGE